MSNDSTLVREIGIQDRYGTTHNVPPPTSTALAAPEINAGASTSAILLLVGALAVIAGKRKRMI